MTTTTTTSNRKHTGAFDVAALVAEHGNLISYPTAAVIVGASVRTLKRLTASGELPVYTVGRTRTLRLKTADVAALLHRVA